MALIKFLQTLEMTSCDNNNNFFQEDFTTVTTFANCKERSVTLLQAVYIKSGFLFAAPCTVQCSHTSGYNCEPLTPSIESSSPVIDDCTANPGILLLKDLDFLSKLPP